MLSLIRKERVSFVSCRDKLLKRSWKKKKDKVFQMNHVVGEVSHFVSCISC